MRKLSIVLLGCLLSIMILGGCGTSDETSASSGDFVDGEYKVEFENFDSHGYKPQLEITIENGEIARVKYDEVSKDGTLKSEDETYNKKMSEHSSTNPEKAFPELEDQLLSKQDTSIDTVSGATASSTTFKALVEHALNKMVIEGTTTAKIQNLE